MGRYVRSPDIVARHIGGELVLVAVGAQMVGQPGSGSGFAVLNGTAEALWDLLASPATEADLARHLIDTYEVDHGRASADVRAFLEELIGLGAIFVQEE